MRRPRGSIAARLGWGAADQAVSSLTNFGLNLLGARMLGQRDFGVLSICFLTYLLGIGLSRATATDPLQVRFGADPRRLWHMGPAAIGSSVYTAALVCALFAIATATAPGTLLDVRAFVWLLPGALMQDAYRSYLIGAGRPAHALVGDLVWAVALVPWLLLADIGHAMGLLTAWAGSAHVSLLVLAGMTRFAPDVRRGRRWVPEQFELIRTYVGEFLVTTGAVQASGYLVAGLASVGALAVLRAAGVLFGPVSMLIVASGTFLLREFVADAGGRRRLSRIVGAALGGAAALWLVLLLVLPTGGLVALIGDLGLDAEVLIWPVGLSHVFGGLALGAILALRADGVTTQSLGVRALVAGATVAGVAGGAAWSGAYGAAVGTAIGAAVGVGAWWRLRVLHEQSGAVS